MLLIVPSRRLNVKSMSIERVYLIRHGETEWNADGRWQGFAQTELGAEGHHQARKLGRYLAYQPIRAVYSSDLHRASSTAQYVADAVGVPLQFDERLREINLGIFQGMTKPEILQTYPQQFQDMNADYMHYVIPNGESRLQLQHRMFDFWQGMLQTAHAPQGATGSHVAVVSHGGSIRLLLLRLFPTHFDVVKPLEIANTSITTIDIHDGDWSLVHLPQVPHLQVEEEHHTGGEAESL
jgi:broad specificity phosphatase PhoE